MPRLSRRLVPACLLGVFATAMFADTTRIAFGSCADEDEPDHPVWDAIVDAEPGLMIMMGDNVYADTPMFRMYPNALAMSKQYEKLAATPGFQRVRARMPVLATWDDHDYGVDDGGNEFAFKETAEQIFLDFWGFAEDAPVRGRPGVYSSKTWTAATGEAVRVILLDTRYFRSPLTSEAVTARCQVSNYVSDMSEDATILGDAQWDWLEHELAEPADLRIVVSSIQLIPDDHCWERWGTFPRERARFFELVRKMGAKNVVLVSGDRHLGDISVLSVDDADTVGYPLYELTSSPLSAEAGFGEGETNRYRVIDDNVRVSNFGLIEVNWERSIATVLLKGADGATLAEREIQLDLGGRDERSR